MCGIVGILSAKKEPSLNAKKWLWQAIFTNSLRGFDSTGIMTPDSNGEVDIFKKAVTGPDFLETKYANQLIDNPGWFAIAHNRAATRGKVSHANAHPFQIEDITLVHNGTVSNGYQLAGKYHEVDSEAICAGLAAHPADLGEYIGKIEGAYALVWHDRVNDTLYMTRNKERPLAYGFTEEGEVLIASELMMLQWLAQRNQLKLLSSGYINEDVVFALKRDNDKITREEISVKKPQPKALTTTGTTHSQGGQDALGIPSNPTTLEFMRQFDIKLHEQVRFVKHVNYGTGVLGTLLGHLTKDPYHEVHVNNVAYNEIQKYLNGTWTVRVRNIYLEVDDKTGIAEPIICVNHNGIFAPRPVLSLVGPNKTVDDKSKETPPVVVNRSIYFDEAGKGTSYKKWNRLVKEAHGKCFNCGDIVNRKMAKLGPIKFFRMEEELCVICPACLALIEAQADASGKGAMVH